MEEHRRLWWSMVAERTSEDATCGSIQKAITADELSYYNHDLEWVCEPGDFDIFIGPDSRRGEPARLTVN